MKVNISIDDVSPHTQASIKVTDRCLELIQEFPEIKFTLFVPIAYWRTVRAGIATAQPLWIHEFPDFCESLKSLPQSNFEICYHGLFHGIPGKNDNDEFQNLNEEEAHEKFQLMFDSTKKAGLENVFKPVFRPPAWRMSSAAIKVAGEVGIKTLALSPRDYAKQTYGGADVLFPHVVYYTCAPPNEQLSNFEINEIVYHACEWDKNYFSKQLANELTEWLRPQTSLVKFSFIGDM